MYHYLNLCLLSDYGDGNHAQLFLKVLQNHMVIINVSARLISSTTKAFIRIISQQTKRCLWQSKKHRFKLLHTFIVAKTAAAAVAAYV